MVVDFVVVEFCGVYYFVDCECLVVVDWFYECLVV